jgi:hypothetical protein
MENLCHRKCVAEEESVKRAKHSRSRARTKLMTNMRGKETTKITYVFLAILYA